MDNNLITNPISIDLTKTNDENLNLILTQFDSLYIYPYSDLKDLEFVSINGEVRRPGKFPFFDSMKLSDLLFLAGDIKESGYKFEVNVFRKKKFSRQAR